MLVFPQKFSGQRNHFQVVRFWRGAFDPNSEVIAAFDRGCGRLRFHGLREIFPRFLKTRRRRVKGNLGQRDLMEIATLDIPELRDPPHAPSAPVEMPVN